MITWNINERKALSWSVDEPILWMLIWGIPLVKSCNNWHKHRENVTWFLKNMERKNKEYVGRAYLSLNRDFVVWMVAMVTLSDWHHFPWPVSSWSVCATLDPLRLVQTPSSHLNSVWFWQTFLPFCLWWKLNWEGSKPTVTHGETSSELAFDS